jgi:Fic family protein
VTDDRSSRPGHRAAFVEPDDETRARLEAENGLRQFDRLAEMIDDGVKGRFRLRPSQLLELNRVAVEGLIETPGQIRDFPIEISGTTHLPPNHQLVPGFVDEMCDYVNDNWSTRTPNHLASYVMWRLNWIHPFRDGNGRTSRAASYMILCIRLGFRLPGTPTIPERIAADKNPYYSALDSADSAWNRGMLDVTAMEQLLEAHLAAQLLRVVQVASGAPG